MLIEIGLVHQTRIFWDIIEEKAIALYQSLEELRIVIEVFLGS
jgi:hypothetical protein